MQTRRGTLRGAVAALLVPCAVGGTGWACGSSSGGSGSPKSLPDAGTDASAHPDGTTDAGPSDATFDTHTPATDAVADSGASDAILSGDGGVLAALSGCLGTEQALTISSQMPYVNVPVGTESGEFVLDFATTFSSIDPTAFPTPPVTTTCPSGTESGDNCYASFDLFNMPGPAALYPENFSDIQGTVRQAGIVGTDFLSEGVFTLAYGAAKAFEASSSGFCGNAMLQQAGFFPLTTAGFFENDLSLLEEFTQVDSTGEANTTVPNVPTVPVQIAGVSAVAQLDTGFDDGTTKFSVNINEAFLSAVMAANATALVRDSSLDETLTTCVNNVSENILGYRLAAGSSFGFVDTSGNVARSYPNAVIFVKDTPPAAATCGGIGIWTVPAAQVAASFYNDMGVIAFDPYHATVWIPGN